LNPITNPQFSGVNEKYFKGLLAFLFGLLKNKKQLQK
jgi:hypothetical protein